MDRIKQLPRQVNIDFTLSATQQGALDSIKNIFTQKDVCLLHGVTGSGKTQVYITLIEAAFAKDLQVLYLLPEIAYRSNYPKAAKAFRWQYCHLSLQV